MGFDQRDRRALGQPWFLWTAAVGAGASYRRTGRRELGVTAVLTRIRFDGARTGPLLRPTAGTALAGVDLTMPLIRMDRACRELPILHVAAR
jgi:hypothetical protein